MDLKLPKVDAVLKEIRSNEHTRFIPVAVLTSSAEEKDRIETYKLGVNSYIIKPVGFDHFAKVVAEICFYRVLVNRPPVGRMRYPQSCIRLERVLTCSPE